MNEQNTENLSVAQQVEQYAKDVAYGTAEAIVEFLLTFTNEPVYDETSYVDAPSGYAVPIRPWDRVPAYLVRGVSKNDVGWAVTIKPVNEGVHLTLHAHGLHGVQTRMAKAADAIRWLRCYLADDYLTIGWR